MTTAASQPAPARPHYSDGYKTLVLVSPVLEIPIELEKEITVLNFPLPTREELAALLHQIVADVAQFKKAISHSYWLVDEWSFASDVDDFHVRLTPLERSAVRVVERSTDRVTGVDVVALLLPGTASGSVVVTEARVSTEAGALAPTVA